MTCARRIANANRAVQSQGRPVAASAHTVGQGGAITKLRSPLYPSASNEPTSYHCWQTDTKSTMKGRNIDDIMEETAI